MGNKENSMYKHLGLEVVNAEGTGNNNPAQPGVTEYWSQTKLSTGKWYKVVMSFDGNTGVTKMMINGKLEPVRTIYPWSGHVQSTVGYDFLLGRTRSDKPRFLDGRLDNFRVYDRALTEIEMANPGQVGLVAHWKLDEGKGTTSVDASGNGNTLTLYGAKWQTR